MQNPKEEYIGCLSLILILWLVGGVVSFFASIVYVIAMPLPAVAIFVLICEVVYLAGLLLMLMRKKSGFYLFVGSCVLMLLAGLLYPESFDDTWVFRIPLALLLILILMAIKNKKTKLNGYQVLGITESDEDLEDEDTTKDNVQIETTETDASISEETASTDLPPSSSYTTSQNEVSEPISNDDEIKNDNEKVKDGLASLAKVEDDDTNDEVIVSTLKNEDPGTSAPVVGPESAEDDAKKSKNRKDWIIAVVVLAVVILISGVAISLSQCSRKTPEEIFKEAKTLIDNHQYEKGIAELEKIQANYIPAKALLGRLYTMNDSVRRDMDRGKQLLLEAFEKNDTSAGNDLVHLYFISANWDSIYQVAEKLTILNADKGYRALAWLHWTDKIGGEINKHKDYSKAEYYALQVADKDTYSCFYLGHIYSEGGNGIKKDYAKAFYWWKHGSELGESGCSSNLGWLYLNGYGVNRNYKKAYEAFRKAIEQDHTDGYPLYQIANMYYDGCYVKANRDSAKLYYQKAAKLGIEDAAITIENDF